MEQKEENRKSIVEQMVRDLTAGRNKEVLKEYEKIHPIDLAVEMEAWEGKLLKQFCSIAEDGMLAEILEASEVKLQQKLMEYLDNEKILRIFANMQKDDIADILGDLKIGRSKALVDLMKTGDRKIIVELLGYGQETAGGLMTTGYIALDGRLTIRESLQKIKRIGPKTELIETIFVLNSRKQLVGTADLRDILMEQDDKLLESIMDDQMICVEPETDQEEVSLMVSKYDLNAIPVVNKRKMLLGIITVDDIIDVIMEESTEDILQMGGVSKEETLDNTCWQSMKMRLPWLLVNLVTAFVAASAVKLFEEVILQVVALSATMSIVTGMGGNAGSQTLSIMIRSIALGEVNIKHCWKIVTKEAVLGIMNGAATGIVTGVAVYVVYGNWVLGLIILIAMIGNLLIAGLFGAVVPLVLKTLHADPALASSIFLTTATDTLGFFVFLGLAKLCLPFLI